MERLTKFFIDKNICNASGDICKQQKSSPYDKDCCCYCERNQKMIDKLADYENAEEQGLLLKLPCKVGDYVYQIDRMLWKIHTRKVSKIELAVTATDSVMTIYFETAGFCYLSHFGKTVFLDKKDALNALYPYSVG